MANNFAHVIPDRAGGDIGSEQIFLAVQEEEVVHFPTHTSGLIAAVAYLMKHNVSSVAVEATGVYWLNFFDLAEKAGLDVWLVSPKYTKTRAGRKTDVQDSQWIERLHSADLLERSYVPDAAMRELRDYVRIRESYISDRTKLINRMTKALIQMNLRLDSVLSQVHGPSGLRIIEAILDGTRDPQLLVALSDTRIRKNKADALLEALHGNFQPQYLYALQMALEDFHYMNEKIHKCDKQIEACLEKIVAHLPEPSHTNKEKPIRHNRPQIAQLQLLMQTLFGGKDLTTLPGITNYTLLRIVSEVGVDLDPWPTKKHFTSWLGLAPMQNQSGKRKGRANVHSTPRAGQFFRQVAQSLMSSKNTALGAFGRRIRSKKGPKVAIKALARKIAELYYNAVTKGLDYVEKGVQAYEHLYQEQQIRFLEKRVRKLGFSLVPGTNEHLRVKTGDNGWTFGEKS